MAIMIPEKPQQFDPMSQEDIMFDALALLPNEYYIFHSFRISNVVDNVFHESETDFIIFNREKGLLCLEAKAGSVRYENGYWYYASGLPMHNGGPFNQASSNKWKLIKYIESSRMANIISHCKFLHAVWFPSLSESKLRTMTLPPEADKVLVMTKESLTDPLKYIERIFSVQIPVNIQTNVSLLEGQHLIRDVLCPQFNVFPTATFEADLKKVVFHRLLNEQAGILNFLEEQKTAVINGAAGTGKTMIAVEKAQRHAAEGQSVLFLCYNAQLKTYLSENYSNNNIDYYTISGLACKFCDTKSPDYGKLKDKLDDMYLSESFPYQHVIVDEGQDFGMEDIEEANILEVIKSIITDTESINGTFYVFYDRLQLIQANQMPRFIEDADCKLKLYRNCRNTENIALTSLRPLSAKRPKLLDGCVKGTPATFYFCSSIEAAVAKVDSVINAIKAEGYKDVVILTCKTENTSILSGKTLNGLYRNKYRFTTCRKFKGLEADVVLLIDVDGNTFNSENVLIYYVGTSRARIKLEIITTLTDGDCLDILHNCLHQTEKIKNPKRNLSSALNGIGIVSES